MDNIQVKSIIAAILWTDLDKDQLEGDGVCSLGAAADLAEDLFNHVIENNTENGSSCDHDGTTPLSDWGTEH